MTRVKSFVSSPEDVAHVGAGDDLQTALIVGVYQRTPTLNIPPAIVWRPQALCECFFFSRSGIACQLNWRFQSNPPPLTPPKLLGVVINHVYHGAHPVCVVAPNPVQEWLQPALGALAVTVQEGDHRVLDILTAE